MPSTLYTEAIKEAYAIAPAAISHINTIELRHPSLSDSLRLVQGYQNKELTVEGGVVKLFTALPFNLTLPATNEGGLQELTLTIDNVNNAASNFCEMAMNFPAPVEIIYRPYLSNDPTTPQMDPPLRLFLLNVTVQGSQVSGRAVPCDFINMEFPSELYTRSRFPALGNT
jgi:hypothetical protein